MQGDAIDHSDDDAADQSFLKLAVAREQLHLRVPSRVDWVERSVMYLANQAQTVGACDPQRATRLVTALTEAITNAIVHGNLEISSQLKERADGSFAQLLAERSMDPAYAERLVDIEMHYDGGRCEWIVTDQGRGFDIDKVLARLESDDPQALLASGRGIMLMRAFLDDVSWSMGGRQVRMAIERPAGERRRDPRTPGAQPVRAMPMDGHGGIDWSAAFDAVATNLSHGGLAMLKQGLHAAQRLMIELQVDGKPVYVPAQVCNFKPVSDGIVQIGCRFDAPEPAGDPDRSQRVLEQHDAIGRILDRLEGPAPRHDERRQHARRAYSRPVRVVADDAAERLAVGRDLSRSGMAFVAEFSLQRGQTVQLTLESDVQLRATVMRCQHVAGHFYDIGVGFET